MPLKRPKSSPLRSHTPDVFTFDRRKGSGRPPAPPMVTGSPGGRTFATDMSLPPSPGQGHAWPLNSTSPRLPQTPLSPGQPLLTDTLSPTTTLHSRASQGMAWSPAFTRPVSRGGVNVARTPTFGIGERFGSLSSSRRKVHKALPGDADDSIDEEVLLYLPSTFGRQPASPNRSSSPPVFGTSTRDHWSHVTLPLPKGARKLQTPDKNIKVGPGSYPAPPLTLARRAIPGIKLHTTGPKVQSHKDALSVAARSPGPITGVAQKWAAPSTSFGFGGRSKVSSRAVSPGPAYKAMDYIGKSGRSAGFGFGKRF